MTGPTRLKDGGGASRRLLDSASLDVPSSASRARAQLLASTASSFAHTRGGAGGAVAPLNVAKTVAVWALVGAAASVALALGGSKLLEATSSGETKSAALPALTDLPTVAKPSRPSEIAPEPQVAAPLPVATIEPWVPSPKLGDASADELRDLENVRAAVQRRDASAALVALDAYDASYPSGHLKAESMLLRIQALSLGGKGAEARSLANAFLRQYPGHALATKVRDLSK